MQREVIARTLAQRAGQAPDARAVAEASVSTWTQVSERLAPVIGERGVEALFQRSLHLGSATYPWLAVAATEEPGVARLDRLRLRLVERDSGSAAEASALLLLTFSALLAAMIGDALTDKLLEPVWATPALDTKPENES